jgi:anaerobic selenocysteine-containing dehydrogenase
VRNVAKYSPPLFARGEDQRHDWEIYAGLWARLKLPAGSRLAERALGKLGPEAILDLGLRVGPHRLSLKKLAADPHGVDLGALEPRFPKRLGTRDKKVQLAPKVYLDDLPRLERAGAPQGLVMIGRRHLRSNNSWLHNSERLVKGPPRCTVMMHPADAAARGLSEGATAKVASARGTIELPVEITDAMKPGVVSVPHGWGHGRKGVRLRVASSVPGASINDVIDPERIDALSGTSALSGQPVEVS